MYAKQGLTLREEIIVGSEDTESVWATLFGGNGSKTTIGLCYVPPNDREADVKLHIYREVCKDNKQCVIICDFNHRTIDWDTQGRTRRPRIPRSCPGLLSNPTRTRTDTRGKHTRPDPQH